MKNEKRFRFKPLPWFILIEVILVLILFLCGFRITYSPSLENSWNAISAVASWASVFVSGLAIYGHAVNTSNIKVENWLREKGVL